MNLEEDAKFLALVTGELARLDTSYKGVSEDAVAYGGLHQAAAVLVSFDPDRLEPVPGSPGEHVEELLANCVLGPAELGKARWSLLPEVRAAVLRQMGSREALRRALDANHLRPDTPLQRMVEAYIRGDAPRLHEQTREELAASFQAVEWLAPVLDDLPPRDALAWAMERASLLQPLEDLAGTHFRGRQPELRRLRDYVGVVPPGTPVEAATSSLARGAQEVPNLHERPPMLVHGPGGMGKSTLLARFVLDHARLDAARRIPFAYLDLERPELEAAEPLTLLIEAVRQLGIQYPAARPFCERIRGEWQQQLADMARRTETRRAAMKMAAPAVRVERAAFIDTFRNLLQTMDLAGRPLLFVLDTFEEVQYRSRASLQELWDFLVELQAAVPRLRVVLACRAPIPEYRTEDLPLAELDEEAAQGFLEAHGVSDSALARRLARRLGGNPLTLKLASEVLRQSGVQALETGEGLDQLTVQRQLYRRILNRIHDPEVRTLAHPGLALRRVTPALILDVLAEPCGLEIETLADANALFEKLRAEDSLVSAAEEGAVRHRPELRRIMLPLLQRDQPEKVATIHARAVAYYERQEGLIARAEEIYHRLSLRQSPAEIDPRWVTGLDPFLSTALDELPPSQRAYLAARIGVEVDAESQEAAAIDDWQRDAARRARELLALGRPEAALGVVRERRHDPGTALDTLEVAALVALGRLDEARLVLNAAIGVLLRGGNRERYSQFLLMAAQLAIQADDHAHARHMLEEAEALLASGELRDPLRQLELMTAHVQLDAAVGVNPRRIESRRASVRDSVEGLTDDQLAAHTPLLRGILGMMTPEDGPLAARLIRLLGPQPWGPAERRVLGHAFAAWDLRVSDARNEPPGVLARALQLRPLEKLSDTWVEFTQAVEAPQLARTVARLVEAYAPTPDLLATLQRLFEPTPRKPAPAPAPPIERSERGRFSRRRRSSRSEDVGDVPATAAQIREVAAALVEAFPTADALRELLKFRLHRQLDAISFKETASEIVPELVDRARTEGWLADLIVAARQARPDSARVQAAALELGLGSAPAGEVTRVLRRADQFIDINEWRVRLGEIEGRVCRVEVEESKGRMTYATGFLVGPNLLLTVYHPLDSFWRAHGGAPETPPNVRFRFDYKVLPAGRTLHQGTVYTLASSGWIVDYSEYSQADVRPDMTPTPDQLDYALLRLDGLPGADPVGGERAEPGASKRGWIAIPREPYEFVPDSPLSIMQHAAAGPLKLASDTRAIIGLNDNGTRVRYRTVTEGGSAGAPCFSSLWELVAMHHAYRWEPGAKVNQGIPISAIVARLGRRGLLGVLDEGALA